MYENELYADIPQLLKSLKEQNSILVIEKTKPIVFSEQILKHFNIEQYFYLFVGSNLDGTRTYKSKNTLFLS